MVRRFTGSLGGFECRYQVIGGNCDTTAELETISGAIEHHLKTVENGQLCSTDCLDLTHGGTWNGFLLIGPETTLNASIILRA